MVLAQMHRSRRRRSALYKRPGDGLSGFGASRLALPFGQRAASEFLAARSYRYPNGAGREASTFPFASGNCSRAPRAVRNIPVDIARLVRGYVPGVRGEGRGAGCWGWLFGRATRLNARSNSSFVASAPISRAISMNRLDCSGSCRAGNPPSSQRRRPTELDLPLDWTEQYKRHCQVEVF